MANYIIFAASSSIGQAVTQDLLSKGNKVFTTARDNLKINPDKILDATNFSEVETCFDEAITKLGSIDGVVNCSGSLLLKSAGMTSEAQYFETINASLTTSFAIVRSAGKKLNNASIVLISSAAALEGLANHEAIAAAKAGIIGLMRSAAATYASSNLRFNAVAPGLVATNLTKSLTSSDASIKVSESMHALGRLGKPEDVARAICFLLDTQNDWITGQVIGVDGGLSRVRPKTRV